LDEGGEGGEGDNGVSGTEPTSEVCVRRESSAFGISPDPIRVELKVWSGVSTSDGIEVIEGIDGNEGMDGVEDVGVEYIKFTEYVEGREGIDGIDPAGSFPNREPLELLGLSELTLAEF
jgi:hypothetical protein